MFKEVVNVTLGEVEQRIMMTGKHFTVQRTAAVVGRER
ncbi:Protein of unknown function, partial [Gryllus bimaculatus]